MAIDIILMSAKSEHIFREIISNVIEVIDEESDPDKISSNSVSNEATQFNYMLSKDGKDIILTSISKSDQKNNKLSSSPEIQNDEIDEYPENKNIEYLNNDFVYEDEEQEMEEEILNEEYYEDEESDIIDNDDDESFIEMDVKVLEIGEVKEGDEDVDGGSYFYEEVEEIEINEIKIENDKIVEPILLNEVLTENIDEVIPKRMGRKRKKDMEPQMIEGSNVYECKVCSSQFIDKDAYANHIKQHFGLYISFYSIKLGYF